MSTIATNERRPWLVVALGTAAGLAVVVAAFVIIRSSAASPQPYSAHATNVAARGVEQARWRVTTYPAGIAAHVTKAQHAAVARQRPRVVSLVRSVYDATLLHPSELRNVLAKSFSKAAAVRFIHSGLKPPRGAEDLVTTTRAARIGIDVHRATRAAARVRVAYTSRLDGRTLSLMQVATLWLERTHGAWKIVAFDGSQQRVRPTATRGHHASKHDKREAKKDKR